MDEIAELGGINNFIKQMNYMHQKFAPKTDFFPDLALGYSSDIQDKLQRILYYC
jgi:hypothetical protein